MRKSDVFVGMSVTLKPSSWMRGVIKNQACEVLEGPDSHHDFVLSDPTGEYPSGWYESALNFQAMN